MSDGYFSVFRARTTTHHSREYQEIGPEKSRLPDRTPGGGACGWPWASGAIRNRNLSKPMCGGAWDHGRCELQWSSAIGSRPGYQPHDIREIEFFEKRATDTDRQGIAGPEDNGDCEVCKLQDFR